MQDVTVMSVKYDADGHAISRNLGTAKPTSFPQGRLPEIPAQVRGAQVSRVLLDLPDEILRKILQYLLDFEETAVETVRWDPIRVDDYQHHKEIAHTSGSSIGYHKTMLQNGLRTLVTTEFHVNVLRTCKRLCQEGQQILRRKNKFVSVRGLKRNNDTRQCDALILRRHLGQFGIFPSWPLACFKARCQTTTTAGLPPLPEINMTVSIDLDPGEQTPLGDTIVFPIRYLGLVCRAVACLPAMKESILGILRPPRSPSFTISLKSGLLPQLLSASSFRFKDILARDIGHAIGKFIVEVDFSEHLARNEVQGLNDVEKWFIKDVRRRANEDAKVFVVNRLQDNVKALDAGEVSVAKGDAYEARRQFFDVKTMIYDLVNDDDFVNTALEMMPYLKLATAWASYRISTQDVAETEGRGDSSESLWMLLQLDRGTFWLSGLYSSTSGLASRLNLRKAELAYMGGISPPIIVGHLFQAACEIASDDLVQNNQPWTHNTEEQKIQQALKLLFRPVTPGIRTPTTIQSDFDDVFDGPEDEEYMERIWCQLNGYSTEPNDVEERELILKIVRLLKMEVEGRYGKIAKRPFVAKELLEWRNA